MFRVAKAGGYHTSAVVRGTVYSGSSLAKVASALRQQAASRSAPARPMHDVLYLDGEVVSAYARLSAEHVKQAPPAA